MAERGEESEAVVARRLRTGCLSPSSLDLAHLKMRDDVSTGTEMSGVLLDCRGLGVKDEAPTRLDLVEDFPSTLDEGFFNVLPRQSTGLQEHQL